MDLMSLLAKLTLDKTEYDTGLEEAEKSAEGLKITTPKLENPAKDYTEGLTKAQEETNVFSEVVSGVWQGLKDSILSISVTGIMLGITNSLKQGVSMAIKSGKEIADNSKNLQLSTRAYQEYDYVLGKSNLSVKNLSTAMDGLDKIMAGKLTKDQKAYVAELEEYGFTVDEAASKEENLANMMKALADYQGTYKGLIIDWLFGKNGNWTGFFEQSSDQIEALKKQASESGLIWSDETIENSIKYTETTEKLQERLEAIRRSFGEGILPVITEAVEKLMMIVDFFTNSDTRTSTQKFTDVDSKFDAKIQDIEASTLTAQTLAKTLLNMGDTAAMDSRQLAIWKGTAESLIEMIPVLSGVIDVENGTISESADGIAELIKQYSQLEKETAYQTAKAEKQNIIDQKSNQLTEQAVKANDELAKAEGNRMQAIDKFNEVLEKYDVNAIGYDATMQEIEQAKRQAIMNAGTDEYTQSQAAIALQDAVSTLTDAIQQASLAQAKADELSTDIEEGEAALAGWIATYGEVYENTSSTAQSAAEDAHELKHAIEDLPDGKVIDITIRTNQGLLGGLFGNAKGNWDVPYDNFPALLHRNEMVLSASQARRYRDGESGSVNYDTIAEIVAVAVGDTLNKVNVLMSGEKVGDLTTRRVKNNINSSSYSRLRAFGG